MDNLKILGFLALADGIFSGIVGRVSTWSRHSAKISTFERTDHPIRFYLHVGIYFVLGVVMLVVAGRGALR